MTNKRRRIDDKPSSAHGPSSAHVFPTVSHALRSFDIYSKRDTKSTIVPSSEPPTEIDFLSTPQAIPARKTFEISDTKGDRHELLMSSYSCSAAFAYSYGLHKHEKQSRFHAGEDRLFHVAVRKYTNTKKTMKFVTGESMDAPSKSVMKRYNSKVSRGLIYNTHKPHGPLPTIYDDGFEDEEFDDASNTFLPRYVVVTTTVAPTPAIVSTATTEPPAATIVSTTTTEPPAPTIVSTTTTVPTTVPPAPAPAPIVSDDESTDESTDGFINNAEDAEDAEDDDVSVGVDDVGVPTVDTTTVELLGSVLVNNVRRSARRILATKNTGTSTSMVLGTVFVGGQRRSARLLS